MTDDFNEFFDDNTHWSNRGQNQCAGAKPPEPPKSRKEMRKRRAHRKRKRISGIIMLSPSSPCLSAGGYFGGNQALSHGATAGATSRRPSAD